MTALENRRFVRGGGDPVAEKRKAAMPLFRDAAEKVLAANRAGWRGKDAVRAWRSCMDIYVLPRIGDMRVNHVGREQVLAILVPLYADKPESARKCRIRLKAVFSWCQSHGFIEGNPADAGIDGALPRKTAAKEHLKALHHKGVADTLLKIRDADGCGLAPRYCLEFLILTATRSAEARGATWNEIDLDARTWTIPAERMKSGREHRIPLSGAALAVLEQARALDDGSGLIFPAARKAGAVIDGNAMRRVLTSIGLKGAATIHGYRSSFRDWAADSGKDRELAESALAHVVGGTEGAYFRSDMMDRRRELMEQWAAYVVETTRNKVVQLRG